MVKLRMNQNEKVHSNVPGICFVNLGAQNIFTYLFKLKYKSV